ncbi:uncharacterized protein LOC134456199 [Engraulis encrasicolus]|uniref:uncharacterized protein LOC134456199 n=1 Tax=Engraulis encrasicolus TaxID=184585 RepID=UPI002FD223C6
MNFGNNCFNYICEAFPQHQGVQEIFTNLAESTSINGLAPTTGSGVITQPGVWPEYHGYQPKQHSGLLGCTTALPQLLPVPEMQVLHPVHPQGFHGEVTLQGRAVPFDRRLQGSMVFVNAVGHQHGTSVASHPLLQVSLATMDGTDLQYSTSPAFTAPQMHAPVMRVVANGQQLGASGPFLTPQPQAPVMLIDGRALLHGAPVPVYSTGLQHGNAVALNSQLASFVAINTTHLQHVAPMPQESSAPMQVACNTQLPKIAAGLSSANPTRPAPGVKPPSRQCQQDPKASSSYMPGSASYTQSCGTTASSRPVATKSTVDKSKKTWDEDLRAMLECPAPSSIIFSQESLVAKKEAKKRRAERAKQKDKGSSTNTQAPNTTLTKITQDQAPKKAVTEINKDQEAKTCPTWVGKANTVLPKESKEAGKNKDKKRKHKPDADEMNKRKEKRCKKAKQDDVSQTSQSVNIPFTSRFKVPKKPNYNAPVCSTNAGKVARLAPSQQHKPAQLLYDASFIEACTPLRPPQRPRHHGQRHHGHQQQSRSQPSHPQHAASSAN